LPNPAAAEDSTRASAAKGTEIAREVCDGASDPRGRQIERCEWRGAAPPFHLGAEHPQGPHVEEDVRDTPMKKDRREESPPLPCLKEEVPLRQVLQDRVVEVAHPGDQEEPCGQAEKGHRRRGPCRPSRPGPGRDDPRSEEHTS